MTISTDSPSTSESTDPSTERRRRWPLLWVGGAMSAAVLVLAVNGTLSSWTTAIIDNNDNDVAVVGAVALVETGPGDATCDTGEAADNHASCDTINKYGGTGGALDPDGTNSRTVSVNLANTGTVAGQLVLTADDCTSSAAAGSTGADPSGHPICDQVTVGVTCSSPATLDTTAAPVALASFSGGTVGTLAAGADTDCVFTLTLPTGTPSSYASQVAAQVLHWTLTAS
jgi:hypothetical protein